MDGRKSIMAEKAIIGCLLIDQDAFDEVSGILSVNDFHDQICSRVFGYILELKKKYLNHAIDIITLSTFAKNTFNDNENDIFVELASLANGVFVISNIKSYIEIVKKESKKRKSIIILNSGIQRISNDEENYLDFVKKEIINIENDDPSIVLSYSDLLYKVIDDIEEKSKSDNSLSGVSTGFYDLDFYTSGLQGGDLIILAARPGSGKTMLMLNIADNIGIKGQLPVVLFSLEMSASQICKRSLSRFSKIRGELIFNNKLKNEHWPSITKSLDQLSKSKVFINDSSNISVYQMKSFCKKIINNHGLKAVFVDYIGLVSGEGENETLRLGAISRDLKFLAKDLNVPVFVLCQLNRNVEGRVNKTPVLSDIRQSGNIEQDADIIMFLEPDPKDKKISTLHIAKHRNGKTGDFKLHSDFEHFEFKNFSNF